MKIVKSLFLGSVLFLTGCNIDLHEKKVGMKCDDSGVVSLAEKILNQDILNKSIDKKYISKLKIDKDNIVSWDYKNNRYLCKAKVTGDALKKFDTLFWVGSNYGLYRDKNKVEGWIYYKTYMTTKDLKKYKKQEDSSFYVELVPTKDIKEW